LSGVTQRYAFLRPVWCQC